MGGQTKGGPRGEFFSFEKRRTHRCWLWKVALAIGAGMVVTMAIFASAFDNDNFQVV
jgi:predicted membrane-bound mannosyltransferase